MNIICHFASTGFLNTYIVSNAETNADAILVNPTKFTVSLLDIIESRKYYIRSILITNAVEECLHGIATISRIYETTLYAGKAVPSPADYKYISPNCEFSASGLNVHAFGPDDHYHDMRIYKIDNLLFTGTLITAGRVTETLNVEDRKSLFTRLDTVIQNEQAFLMPSFGPLSLWSVEKKWNPALDLFLNNVR